ncbi:MAG: putative hydro-lyase [Burkholderiales bacterium]|nr:putative hydro-lyase [Burkholderiales bacterium]
MNAPPDRPLAADLSADLSAGLSALERTDARALRLAIRAGRHHAHTVGLAPGRVQGNLVVLPQALAGDFMRFCQRNPKPCPLLAVTEPGDPVARELGEDVDLRTDVPRYRVWREGVLEGEVDDLRALWRDDWVGFVLGCSFSFEQALLDDGIPLRHVAEGRNVAMYRTSIPTSPAGRFSGPLVVSMRPMTAAHAIRAVQVTSRFPSVHGAPVHFGDPAAIGIADLSRPDYGDAVDILPGEVPVFWACGVTPQAALIVARPEVCVTHAPGCMLVTDRLNTELAAF